MPKEVEVEREVEREVEYETNARNAHGGCGCGAYVEGCTPAGGAGMLIYGASHSIARLFEGTVSYQLDAQRLNMATAASCVDLILNRGRHETKIEDLLAGRLVESR